MQSKIGAQTLDAEIEFGDSGSQTFNYNVDATINYIDMLVAGVTYRQSFTYSSGKVATISAWVAQ